MSKVMSEKRAESESVHLNHKAPIFGHLIIILAFKKKLLFNEKKKLVLVGFST